LTRLLLIRHAAFPGVGQVLAGRSAGVGLSDDGRLQATRLADSLAGTRLAAVIASPQQRAQETAAPLAQRHGMGVLTDTAFDEVDFGDWTGRTIESLRDDPGWHAWNTTRATARPPGGELFTMVQARAMAGATRLSERFPDAAVAVVTHADVIRAMLAVVLGMAPGGVLHLDVDPASVSTLDLHGAWPQVRGVNHSP
jgi:ribonuclease H / adenosylcobalamin/alpha-ribazole phosphatase